MAFFKKKHKVLASNLSCSEVKNRYRNSEDALRRAAVKGDEKALKEAMEKHQLYEYTMLYQTKNCNCKE